MPDVAEEYWTKRDGTKIAVGDMDVDHLRNVLRMLIRVRRRTVAREMKAILSEALDSMTEGEWHDRVRRDLSNPDVFFPLLDGGVYGSTALQQKYGRNL